MNKKKYKEATTSKLIEEFDKTPNLLISLEKERLIDIYWSKIFRHSNIPLYYNNIEDKKHFNSKAKIYIDPLCINPNVTLDLLNEVVGELTIISITKFVKHHALTEDDKNKIEANIENLFCSTIRDSLSNETSKIIFTKFSPNLLNISNNIGAFKNTKFLEYIIENKKYSSKDIKFLIYKFFDFAINHDVYSFKTFKFGYNINIIINFYENLYGNDLPEKTKCVITSLIHNSIVLNPINISQKITSLCFIVWEINSIFKKQKMEKLLISEVDCDILLSLLSREESKSLTVCEVAKITTIPLELIKKHLNLFNNIVLKNMLNNPRYCQNSDIKTIYNLQNI